MPTDHRRPLHRPDLRPKADRWANFDSSSRALSATITSDRERYRPGDEATFAILTTNAAGRGMATSVAIRGVDQKLFAIGAAREIDPLRTLYRRLRQRDRSDHRDASAAPQCRARGRERRHHRRAERLPRHAVLRDRHHECSGSGIRDGETGYLRVCVEPDTGRKPARRACCAAEPGEVGFLR